MNSRRRFLGQFAGSIGGLAALPETVLGANERIRFGIIGYGARGEGIVRDALNCPNTEFRAVCDIYTEQREKAKSVAPAVQTFIDHRLMLEDKDLDAVLIATPQHLHCQHFVDAIEAGKHVYQEKTMAFSVEHAKRMRAAYEPVRTKQIVQIGHQSCSSGHVMDAKSFLAGGKLGKITAIDATMYRNTPHGKPQWSRIPQPGMNTENIVWNKFLGEAPKIPFDANRYLNWRFFWDYSGGNVYENMCHQLAFWYKILDLKIPKSATMNGGIYLWKDGREVPDTMNVTMEHEEELLYTWDSGFGNDQLQVTEDVLGDNGTISRTPQSIKYLPQKVNRKDGNEMTGTTRSDPKAHMQNFLDSIRASKQPNCPLEIGYRISIACRMAVESYRQGRTMRWDSTKEEII